MTDDRPQGRARRRSAPLFLSWTPHHRAEDIAQRLGGSYVVPARWSLRSPWFVRYPAQAVASLIEILRRRPDSVLITNPPFIALAPCLLAAAITRSPVWADCHSGVFNDPRWSRFAKANDWIMRRCDGVILHNYAQGRHVNGRAKHVVFVTTDGMRDRFVNSRVPVQPALVVVPASYQFDEPIDAILEAAALMPDCRFVLTGTPPEGRLNRAPENVGSSGWLDPEAYHRLLDDAAVVACFTTREDTMQGGVLEALEHGRPAVTSPTQTLRTWGSEVGGVAFVDDHEPRSIASTLRAVLDDYAGWSVRAAEGHVAALARADFEIGQLRAALHE